MKTLLVGIAISLLAWISPLPAVGENSIDRVDRLLASGNGEQALAEAGRAREALSVTERLTAWEQNHSKGEVRQVLSGRKHLYYIPCIPEDDPVCRGALETVSASKDGSDWKYIVVCLDLESGLVLWSRKVEGLTHMAVNPQSDVLYLYRQQLLALAPDSGKVLDQQELPNEGRGIRGLLLGNEPVIPQPQGSEAIIPDSQVLLYDPVRKLSKPVDLGDRWLLAPDESCRLIPGYEGWDCICVPDGQKRWTQLVPLGRTYPPLWHSGQPVFVAGSEWERSAVTALDLATGKPRWSTVLGWGCYTPTLHQFIGNSYSDNWTPFTAVGQHLLALDGSGRLCLLDPADGRVVAAPRLGRDFPAMPFQYRSQLIVPTFKSIRSYSLANLLRSDAPLDVMLQIREVRCLRSLGRHREALALSDSLVERAPQFSAVWSERALVCQALDMAEEEVFSRCQALTLAEQVSDDVLLSRCGLRRQYNLDGKPAWPLMEVGGRVYAGTLAGTLWRIDTDSLEITVAAQHDGAITSLPLVSECQMALGVSAQAVPVSPPADARIPMEWTRVGGRISGAVAYRGRQFRSQSGGVRVLSGTNMVQLSSPLENIGPWQIHLSPAGPLGYGAGVFELDDDLRPVRWLIRPTVNGQRGEGLEVLSLRSTSRTIGLVVGSSQGSALQVYSRQGVLLNDVSLGELGEFVSREVKGPAQLLALGDGYLFSDRQLVWASAAEDRRVWRFGPPLARTEKQRSDRWRYFGNPLLANGCLYVSGLDGCLYIFDAAQVTATPAPAVDNVRPVRLKKGPTGGTL
jgi:outer membrane protein assembly factor BamB